MKYAYVIFLPFFVLISCEYDDKDETNDSVFAKWRLLREEEQYSTSSLIRTYIVEPYCDAEISEVTGVDFDKLVFCNPEEAIDCITYDDSQYFVEISENGNIKFSEITYSESFYSNTTESNAGNGLFGEDACLIKVIQNSVKVEEDEFSLVEAANVFSVNYKSRVFEKLERVPNITINDEGNYFEDVFYEEGEKVVEYEYSINEENELFLKFVDDFSEITWYLERVD